MKKILVSLLLLAALSGFAMAQEAEDEGIGLSVGIEAGVQNLQASNEGDPAEGRRVYFLAPILEYENTLAGFDVYLKGQYFFGFLSPFYGEDNRGRWLETEQDISYTAEADKLTATLGLNNELVYELTQYPKDGGGPFWYDGAFEPSLTFAYDLDVAEVRAGGGVNLAYEQFADDAESGSFYTIGFSASGVGVDFRQNFLYSDVDGAMQNKWSNFDIVLSYEKEDVFYAEVEIETGSKKWKSLQLTPSFEVYLGDITLVGEAAIYALGDDFTENPDYPIVYDENNWKPTYDAKIGVKYSF
jgi:hypothetical protein